MRLAWRVAVALALVASSFASAGAEDRPPPLYVLMLDVVSDEPPQLDRALRVRLVSSEPRQLAAGLPGVVSVAEDHLVVDLERSGVLGAEEPAAPQPSFVLDYDQDAVVLLAANLREGSSSVPSDAELIAFVRETVEPTSGRGFDIASQVATYRVGDCTEHAVLTAALARAVGLPAHVIFGTVIARSGPDVGAFGHAWAEVHRDGAWTIVDATPIAGAQPLAYLPEGRLTNEGPGYAFDLAGVIASGIRRVEVLGNVPGAAP